MLHLIRYRNFSSFSFIKSIHLKNDKINIPLFTFSLPSPTTFSMNWSILQQQPFHGLKSSASDLRKGDWVYYDSKAMIVTNISNSCSGRGSRSFTIHLKCILTGNLSVVKPCGDESFEKLELTDKLYQYLYHDDKFIYLSDPESFEQIELNKNLIDPLTLRFLEGGSTLRVRMKSDNMLPIHISIYKNLTCTVQKIISKDVTTKSQTVTLGSGTTLTCPLFINENEKIHVDPSNGSYLARATA